MKQHLRRFAFGQVHWYGGPNMVLEIVKAKLAEAGVSAARTCMLLVSVMASSNRLGALELIGQYRGSNDALTAEVAAYLVANEDGLERA